MSDLFEKFGKELIHSVRDNRIDAIDRMFEFNTFPRNLKKHSDAFNGMSQEQIEAIKDLGITIVDSVLHDVLLLFENSEWITISLTEEDDSIADIRRAARGDLQGYIFMWAELYSKKKLSGL